MNIEENDFQRNNLKTLADYLINLPENYDHFHMSVYCEDEIGGYVTLKSAKDKISECGTVACAVGHGPVAGIKPDPDGESMWSNYVSDNFCDTWSDEYDWMFGPQWRLTDNTPHGAAKRIYWFLVFGVPDDYIEQMEDDAPLCYV